jgi:beta-galactosidase
MSQPPLSRRDFVQRLAAGAAVAAGGVLGWRAAGARPTAAGGPSRRVLPLDGGWRFGGPFDPAALAADFDDAGFERVTLPHCAAKLSWEDWDPASWEKRWIYRRPFTLPERLRGLRVFLTCEGVMTNAVPAINGRLLPAHRGGYLPFTCELTGHLAPAGNVLAVAVDSRWSNVPPDGPWGPDKVDYFEPGGIVRPVRLEAVPPIFLREVFAKPVDVLGPNRRVEVACTLDAAVPAEAPARIRVEVREAGRVLARAEETRRIDRAGSASVTVTVPGPADAALWDPENPRLYDVVATLLIGDEPVHDHRVRIGFREARFELGGFFLNGRRRQLFGLNRHELFPYVGGAMPRRVMRRDAEILRREFNCNIVRCSHYPQSEAFLDACDEVGLMVWEETPGWGHLGDAAWKELVVQNVTDMVRRDRNHPAIVIWGVRVNESPNDPALYRRTRAVAEALDGSRPTSGSMTGGSRKTWRTQWHQDVFAYDDYHAEPDGSVSIAPPVQGVPYMLAEAVGQFNYSARKGFDAFYRRAGDPAAQTLQALRHAQAHSRAAADPRICGVIAWCGFDYGSLRNAYHRVKTPGVADVFRIPKPGAAFYRAQGDPRVRPVIEPAFYWDFGPKTPRGPGRAAPIFSNCERLEIFLGGRHRATVRPDAKNYPHLPHPPFFADLDCDGAGRPELRIDGYLGESLALSRSFSSDPAGDQLLLAADDLELRGDGADATRLAFRVADKYGADRAFGGGTVTLEISGPGTLVGDNPFALEASGGVGAVWIKARPGGAGTIAVRAVHSSLGERSATVAVRPVTLEEPA